MENSTAQTFKELLPILETAHQAWSDTLSGRLYWRGQVIEPDLGRWSLFRKDGSPCTVCVAGAYYFANTGKTLHRSKVGEVERFLDTIRRGKRVTEEATTEDNKGNFSPRTLKLIKATLAIWPSSNAFDEIYTYVEAQDQDHQLILRLLAGLLANLKEEIRLIPF